ncbi:MAG TPA: hypothetical protein VNZ53_11845 [Steroidobacteraceae bacterium]|nr:hypothetical protein [Steroidobacteraceae bacterium]
MLDESVCGPPKWNCFEHAVVLGKRDQAGQGAISSGSTDGALMPGKRIQFDDENKSKGINRFV